MLVRLLAVSLLASSLLARGAVMHAADDPAARPAVECTPRAGLPNVAATIAAGGEIRVAYFGGSITDQAGWRVKSLAFLQRTYPACRFVEIAASVGGTGSNLGA